MVDYKRIARETVWVYALAFLIIPIGFLIRMLYARDLSVADYGLFYGLFAFFGVFTFLTDFGFISSSFYFATKYAAKGEDSKVKTLIFINQGLQLFMSVIIGVILYLMKGFIIAKFYHNDPHVDFMFNLFIIWWIFQPYKASNYYFFSYFHEQKFSKILEFLELLSVLIISFLGFMYFTDYNVPIIAYLTAMIIFSIVSTLLLYHRHKKYFKVPFYTKKDLFKEVFNYSIFLFASFLFTIILTQMDVLFIQYFKGAEQVAYYTSGFSVANLMLTFTLPLGLILYPTATSLWHQGKKEELSKIFNFVFDNILIFLLPLAIFFLVFSDTLIVLLFTEKFAESALILKIFSFVFIFKIIGGIFVNLLACFGRADKSSYLMFYVLVAGVILDIIAIQYYGIAGVAVSNGICALLMLVLFFKEVRKEKTIRIDILNNLKIVISSLVFILACFLLRNRINIAHFSIAKVNFLINGGTIFLIALAAYIGCLFAFGIISKGKIRLIRSLFTRNFH